MISRFSDAYFKITQNQILGKVIIKRNVKTTVAHTINLHIKQTKLRSNLHNKQCSM